MTAIDNVVMLEIALELGQPLHIVQKLFKVILKHKGRGPSGLVCGPECRSHGGTWQQRRRAAYGTQEERRSSSELQAPVREPSVSGDPLPVSGEAIWESVKGPWNE